MQDVILLKVRTGTREKEGIFENLSADEWQSQ